MKEVRAKKRVDDSEATSKTPERERPATGMPRALRSWEWCLECLGYVGGYPVRCWWSWRRCGANAPR